MIVERKRRCKCGCGEIVNPGRRFINHHTGRVESEVTKQKRITSLKTNWAKDDVRRQNLIDMNKHMWNDPGYRAERVALLSKVHKGKVPSDELRKIWSIQRSGPGNSNWKGGISIEPYCAIWADGEYKKSIFERDNYKCQNHDCWGTSNRMCLHHIDYDKKNCHPWNLITLCYSCNSRANFNRGWWQEYYNDVIRKREVN